MAYSKDIKDILGDPKIARISTIDKFYEFTSRIRVLMTDAIG